MDKLDAAIERLRTAAEMSAHLYKKPLLLTYSGGKDSDVCLELANLAGIPFEVQHSHTTADAPETVRHVRQKLHALEMEGIPCTISYPYYKGRRTSMWSLIPQKLMPPTRLVRYCCDVLKEQTGNDRWIITGVRWAESTRRKSSRGIHEAQGAKSSEFVKLTTDNDDLRKIVEACAAKNKRVVNPIIDWTDEDVWSFLQDRRVRCNPLYGEFARVGCIGCPMAGTNGRQREFMRWPAYKAMYLRAFEKMLEERRARGLSRDNWHTAQDVYHWWMEDGVLPGQIGFFDDAEGAMNEAR